MDAASELAQLVERAVQSGGDAIQLCCQLVDLGRYRRLRHPKPYRERDELLPGSVVQIPLDPPTRLVRGGDDARPRGPTGRLE